jgi:GT2 family glycosyltransferase
VRVDPQPTIAYVIVAYRSAGDIAACLDAIQQDMPAGSEIIVVDNASPDDSAGVARAHPSRPTIVTSPENRGFGSGCNLGAGSARSDLLFFVNPDARLVPGATGRLLEGVAADEAAVVFGAAVLGPGGSRGAASAGFEPSLRSVAGHYLFLARLPYASRLFPPLQLPASSAERSPDWVSGAAMLVRASAYEAVGGFDEALFMYMEDVDLCCRLRERGGRVRYVPEARVDHALGGSQGGEQAARWFRAFFAYVARHRGTGEARLVAFVTAAGLALRSMLLRTSNPPHSRRLASAARCGLDLALHGGHA